MNYRPPHSKFSSFREAEMCLMTFRRPSSPAPEARPVSTQAGTAPLLNHLKLQKVPAYRKREHKSEYFQGWRMRITLCATTAGIVPTINIIVTLWESIKFGVHEALVTIQDELVAPSGHQCFKHFTTGCQQLLHVMPLVSDSRGSGQST